MKKNCTNCKDGFEVKEEYKKNGIEVICGMSGGFYGKEDICTEYEKINGQSKKPNS